MEIGAIDDSVFKLELIIDQTNFSDDLNDFDFSWKVIEFEDTFMRI